MLLLLLLYANSDILICKLIMTFFGSFLFRGSKIVFPKQTKERVAKKICTPTTQTLRQNLVVEVLQRHLKPTIIYKDPISCIAHPSIPPNIASKPKPDKGKVIKQHRRCFRQ